MYPLLGTDSPRSAWIDDTAKALQAFGASNREDLHQANRDGRFPRDLYRELGKMGYLGPFVPLEYGGLGGGVAEYTVIAEEIGRHGLVSGQIAVQGQRWLLDWGTDAQKEQWLGAITDGSAVFSECISEKGAGSSFKTMGATATRDGSDWLISGRKTHVNLGADADVTIVYAVAEEGLTSFLVDMTLPGVSSRLTDPIGLRMIPTADVDFRDVRVPNEALLGAVGGGLQTFLSTFNTSRLGNASELIGLGRRALALGVEYGAGRQVGDSLVTDFQGIQWLVADAWASLMGASLARDSAALSADRGDDIALATSLAKKLAIDAAEIASNTGYSLVGGHGLYHSEPYVEILNDIKVLKVAGGSLEVLRNYIARRILKDSRHEGIS